MIEVGKEYLHDGKQARLLFVDDDLALMAHENEHGHRSRWLAFVGDLKPIPELPKFQFGDRVLIDDEGSELASVWLIISCVGPDAYELRDCQDTYATAHASRLKLLPRPSEIELPDLDILVSMDRNLEDKDFHVNGALRKLIRRCIAHKESNP